MASGGGTTGFLMDAAHDGYQPAGHLGPSLTERWKVKLGGPASYAVVVNDTLFTGAGGRVWALSTSTGDTRWSVAASGPDPAVAYDNGTLFAQAGGTLEALKPADGHLLWSDPGFGSSGPPVAGNGSVFEESANGPIAVDEATGKLLWASDYGGTDTAHSAPALSNGQLLVDGASETGSWDPASGSILWHWEYPWEPQDGTAPAVSNSVSWSSTSLQFDSSTGALDGGAVSDFTPAVDTYRSMLESFEPGKPALLDAIDSNGDRLWQSSSTEQWAVSPVITNGYVITATTDGRVTMRSELDGSVAWSASVGSSIPQLGPNNYPSDAASPLAPALAVADNMLFVPTTSGMVAYAGTGPNGCGTNGCGAPGASQGSPDSAGLPTDFDTGYLINQAHTGSQPSDPIGVPSSEAWSKQLTSPVFYPIIADGKVFVRSGDWLYAYNLTDGSRAWGPVDVGPAGSLVYDKGTLFDVEVFGYALAFNATTGLRQWIQPTPSNNVEDGYGYPPDAGGGYLYASGGSPYSEILAMSESTGAALWVASLGGGGTGASPVLFDGDVIQAYSNLAAQSIDPASAQIEWRDPGNGDSGGGSQVSPVVYKGEIWADGYVLNASNGSQIRTVRDAFSPAFLGDTGYFVTSKGTLKARSLNGRARWTFSGNGNLQGSPAASASVVFVGSRGGDIYGLDPATGSVVWHTTAKPPKNQGGQAIGVGQGYLVVSSGKTLNVFH